jgi:hypothetical protein
MQPLRAPPRAGCRGAPGAALALLTLVGVGLAVILAAGGCGQTRETEKATPACSGAVAPCGRRLDEIVFPGTHNSYAASEQSGWYFASQSRGIPRQLDDGIRALLIDVHYGIYDSAKGRVRTDLAAEGSDRNKVARQVPPSALAIADRVAGRVGLGTLAGTPQLYLCHTLCELGAEPLDRELEVIRRFLEAHPDQVVIVIVEDYIPPAAIEAAFQRAGLERFLATLDRRQPLPTLQTLIAQGHRLIVFAEEQGGSPSWYMPAFSFIQDTPLGATRRNQLSCTRSRGEQSSPLLLINHWIPPFPPSPSLNASIGSDSFLRKRVTRCQRERAAKGAIIAVDFYERTSVVEVAKELNGGG